MSKAYDCFPHDLIVDKLVAHGLSEAASKLLGTYLYVPVTQEAKSQTRW